MNRVTIRRKACRGLHDGVELHFDNVTSLLVQQAAKESHLVLHYKDLPSNHIPLREGDKFTLSQISSFQANAEKILADLEERSRIHHAQAADLQHRNTRFQPSKLLKIFQDLLTRLHW